MAGARQHGDHASHRVERMTSAFRDRSVLMLCIVTLTGIGLVAGGWLIQGRTYTPLLLLQLGGSLVLLVPLALLGLMLEDRVRRAENQLRDTAVQLSTLTAVTRQQAWPRIVNVDEICWIKQGSFRLSKLCMRLYLMRQMLEP